jgi:hypothetical protein
MRQLRESNKNNQVEENGYSRNNNEPQSRRGN